MNFRIKNNRFWEPWKQNKKLLTERQKIFIAWKRISLELCRFQLIREEQKNSLAGLKQCDFLFWFFSTQSFKSLKHVDDWQKYNKFIRQKLYNIIHAGLFLGSFNSNSQLTVSKLLLLILNISQFFNAAFPFHPPITNKCA